MRLCLLLRTCFPIAEAGGGDRCLRQLVDVKHQAAAEVRGLVLRDYVLTAETLQEGADFVVSCQGFFLVFHLAHTTHCVTRCLGPIAVLKSPLLGLTYSFQ